jgi:hypothetical protein
MGSDSIYRHELGQDNRFVERPACFPCSAYAQQHRGLASPDPPRVVALAYHAIGTCRLLSVWAMFRRTVVARSLAWHTLDGFRSRHGVAPIDGVEDTSAPSAAACWCCAPTRRTQLQHPRVFRVAFKCAMHHVPLFFSDPQVLRLRVLLDCAEGFWICLYNFSCRRPYPLALIKHLILKPAQSTDFNRMNPRGLGFPIRLLTWCYACRSLMLVRSAEPPRCSSGASERLRRR